VRLLKILLIVVDGLLKVGPGKAKKKSLKNYGIFSQKRCMNPVTTMVVASGWSISKKIFSSETA
jgi:hypothetical protein